MSNDLEKQPRRGQHKLNQTLLKFFFKKKSLSVYDLGKLGHSHATTLRWLSRYEDEGIVVSKKSNTGKRPCRKYRLTRFGYRYINRKIDDYEFSRQERKRRK